MKKFILGILCAFSILTLSACSNINLVIPKTVTIDGVTYRNGFYGDLWPINLTYKSDYIKNGANEFRRVNCEQFDWIHSAIGGTANGMLYCAESQWELAHTYYSDSSNFVYYCTQYNGGDPVIAAIPDIDPEKFDALFSFAEKNRYKPFGSNKNVETRSLPFPDRDVSPELVFYRESKDGYFTSFKGDTYHIIDGKLLLVFYYDYGHGEYEELVAVDVPDELGQYFIDLMTQYRLLI